MMNAKQANIDIILCKLDNINQNNLRNGIIDKTTYDNYKVCIHKLWDINKEN